MNSSPTRSHRRSPLKRTNKIKDRWTVCFVIFNSFVGSHFHRRWDFARQRTNQQETKAEACKFAEDYTEEYDTIAWRRIRTPKKHVSFPPYVDVMVCNFISSNRRKRSFKSKSFASKEIGKDWKNKLKPMKYVLHFEKFKIFEKWF